MKKIILSSTLLILLTFLASCNNRSSVENADGYAEIKTVEYTINPRDWVKDPNYMGKWYFKKNVNEITSTIEQFGFVLIYMKAANAQNWSLMPYTFLERDSKGNVSSVEYSAWWGVGNVEIQFTDTHPTTPILPEVPTYIKVVAVRDVAPSMLPNKVNYSNYDNAKKLLNLPN